MNTLTQPPALKAPFPYPGGKSKVADLVWRRFGDVDNYVEPFAGSLAVLLRRPATHFAAGYRVETVNDANHHLCNFWRAVAADPVAVARYADWPVTEADLHARHRWLVRSEFAAGWRDRMRADPEHFDAKVAGWWVWGQCCWIGSGWCEDRGPASSQMPEIGGSTYGPSRRGVHQPHAAPAGRPQLADAFDIGRGVNGGGAALSRQVPLLSGPGDCNDAVPGAGMATKIPHMYPGGRENPAAPGVGLSAQIPILRGGCGQGVTALPALNTCDARREWLVNWMRRLSDRLRLVRVLYGDWSRPCDSDSTLTRLGTTGVFLDPPYPAVSVNGKKSRDPSLYATDKGTDLNALRDGVLAWCRRWGQDPAIRVAVCGYEGDGYEPLLVDGWAETAWEANGGYANQNRAGGGKAANAKRERIWWSPACLPEQDGPDLFAGLS